MPDPGEVAAPRALRVQAKRISRLWVEKAGCDAVLNSAAGIDGRPFGPRPRAAVALATEINFLSGLREKRNRGMHFPSSDSLGWEI
jgi:hypothetical protein